MKKLAALALFGLLAACANPQQACRNDAASEIRTLNARIATTAGNINRGYAIHRSSPSMRVGVTTCSGGSNFRMCQSMRNGPKETPVAIDVAQEKLKLEGLQSQLAEARTRFDEADAYCRAAYPS